MLQMSEQIGDLAKALSKAQAKIRHAQKDALNPHFKSKYADLAAVIDTIKEPLAEHGLSYCQVLGNEGDLITCTTLLMHESGQWILGKFGLKPQQATPQAGGSCATYLRRYSLQSMVGVAPDEDDDGNAASAKPVGLNPQAGSETKPAKVVVAAPKATTTPNAAASVETFDLKNLEHLKKITKFLQEKNQIGLVEVLCKRLVGKPLTAANVAKEWAAINPEAPDKDPADG